jgi:hypothetical protein
MNKPIAILLAIFVSTALPAGVLARDSSATQTSATQTQADPHAALIVAMETGLDQGLIQENALNTVVELIAANNPIFQGAEAGHAGVTAALRDAIRPTFFAYSARVTQLYRPRMLDEVRAVFTPEEATALTGFYTSAIGQRMMQLMSGNMRSETVANDFIADGQVTADSVNRDVNAAAMRSIGQLSERDRAAMIREALSTPGYTKLPMLQERIAPIRAEMEATPMNGEESSALLTAMQRVAQEYGLLPK